MSFQPSPPPSDTDRRTGTGTGTGTRTGDQWRPAYFGCGGSFAGHVRVNLAVLAALVGIWALTGADYFWPAWAALGMAAGLAFKALVFRTAAFRRSRRPRAGASATPDDAI